MAAPFACRTPLAGWTPASRWPAGGGRRPPDPAEDGVYDGLSVQVDFASEGDGWDLHPDDRSLRVVRSSNLAEGRAHCHPRFRRRPSRVRCRHKGRNPSHDRTGSPAAQTPPAPATGRPGGFRAAPFDVATFTAGLSDAIVKGISEAIEKIPQPQGRQVIPAGRAVVTREAPVYSMNGHGFSMVRDAWKARTEGDTAARERLAKFGQQTHDAAEEAMQAQFAVTTGNASEVIPPGYRPELYVTQLMKSRPLVNSVSRGTLTDATPFTLPRFVSSSGATADHVEGTNPTGGTLDIESVTVTPGGISGVFELTREIVDSANPAIDAIAMQAMQESYSQQTEAKVYTELNGTNGQGGTITSGFVPSRCAGRDHQRSGRRAARRRPRGAGAVPVPPVRRAGPGAPVAGGHLELRDGSQARTAARCCRPIGAQNSAGLGNAVQQGWFIDGLAFQSRPGR